MTLRLIQVGLGAHGLGVGKWYVMYSEDISYTGLVDISPQQLEVASVELGVPRENCYTDYQQAFERIDADAVYIAAASPFHYDICKCALQHNLHVLIEKPFVTDIRQAQELVELANRQNLKLMVDQNYRWNENVVAFKNAIDSKVFGETMFVDAKFFYFHEGKQYQREMKDYMLLEMAIHHIDMIRHLFGGNVQEVRGRTWNTPGSEYVGEPHVHAVYEMSSGFPVFYLGSLFTKGLTSPWEGNWRVSCERGSIHLDDLGVGYGVYFVNAQDEKTKLEVIRPEKEGIHGVLSEFAHAILNDRQPLTSGADNIFTLATAIATSISSLEGRAVQPDTLFK